MFGVVMKAVVRDETDYKLVMRTLLRSLLLANRKPPQPLDKPLEDE